MSKCRNCANANLSKLWKLEDGPYGDSYEDLQINARDKASQPLEIGECPTCGLLQLMEDPDMRHLHEGYLYRSTLTVGLDKYYSDNLQFLLSTFDLKNKRAIDIGCNDGSFLLALKNQGFDVLGVDPAIKQIYENESMEFPILHEFFGSKVASQALKRFGKFGLITINFTLANVTNLRDFLIGVEMLMEPSSVLSIITGYHPDQFSVNMFDYISHDHVSYFSLDTLTRCLAASGLFISDAYRSELKGGSLHILAHKRDSQKSTQTTKRVNYIKQREEWIWPENYKGIRDLRTRVCHQEKELRNFIQNIDGPIAGVGASMSASYLVNQFKLAERIDFLIDDDSSKWGKFSPRYGIPVIPFSNQKVKEINYVVLLSWQHTNVLLDRLRSSGFIGQAIIPLPNLRIIVIE